MPLILDISISKSVTLPIYMSIGDLVTGNTDGLLKKKSLQRGERTCFFIGNSSSLPKEAKFGDQLLGKLDLLEGVKLDGPLYTVQFAVPPDMPSFEDKTTSNELEKDDQLLKDAVRDLEISWLSKLKSDELRVTLSQKLCSEFPKHLPLHLKNLEVEFEKMDKAETFDQNQTLEVLRLCDILLSVISKDELAKYFGVNHVKKTPKDKEFASLKDKEKNALVYALVAKASALQKLVENKDLKSNEYLSEFVSTLECVCEWVGDQPKSHGRYLLLWSWQQFSKGFSGTCLLPIIKFIQEKKESELTITKKLLEIKMNILKELKWGIWIEVELRWNLLKFPKDFKGF